MIDAQVFPFRIGAKVSATREMAHWHRKQGKTVIIAVGEVGTVITLTPGETLVKWSCGWFWVKNDDIEAVEGGKS